MAFIAEMRDIAVIRATQLEYECLERVKFFNKEKGNREHELMELLTDKYYESVKNAIKYASEWGLREKYMNFDREDCKANFPTLGSPVEVLNRWLKEMTTPKSQYIPVDSVLLIQIDLHGLKYDVWNNCAFTVKFTW